MKMCHANYREDSKSFRENLGKRLKEEREKLSLNETELAQKLKVQTCDISKFESGKKMPSADELCRYSKLFRVSIHYLVGAETELEREITSQIHKLTSEFQELLLKIINSNNPEDILDEEPEISAELLSWKLKITRKKRGYTQKELAEEIESTINTISRYENQEFQPHLDVLAAYDRVLGVPVDYFFGLEVSPELELSLAICNFEERCGKRF